MARAKIVALGHDTENCTQRKKKMWPKQGTEPGETVGMEWLLKVQQGKFCLTKENEMCDRFKIKFRILLDTENEESGYLKKIIL